MRESSNPVFRSLPKTQGGYAQFGTGAAGYGAQAVDAEPYATRTDQQQAGVSRPLTIDDVVTKTGITLAVLTAVAVVSYFLVAQNIALATPLLLVGMFGGLGLLLFAIFGRKQDNPAIVLSYAVCEGLVVGAFSFVVANLMVSGISAGALISQAIVGTVRRVLRHARRLQDRRHPRHPEAHPLARRRRIRRCGLDARQPGGGAVRRRGADHCATAVRWRSYSRY